jgi:MFS family permease
VKTVLSESENDTPTADTAKPKSRIVSLKQGFRALEVFNYRLYWIGQLISQSGSWMQRIAQDWLVLQITNSPFAIGVVTALQFLPIMLLSLVGGVLTDRWPKYKLLMITQVAALIQALIFALLVSFGQIQLWHIYVLALLQGIITAIDNPVRQVFVSELVGKKYLANAVVLNSMTFNGARIIGPASAGMLIAVFGSNNGAALVLWINVISFLAVIGGLLLMNRNELHASTPKQGGSSMGREIIEGLQYVAQTPAVVQILIIVAAIGTFGYNFSAIIPLLSGFVLHTDAAGFGGLSAFLGAGSVFGAIAAAYASKVTLKRLIIASGIFSILLGIISVSSNYYVSVSLLVGLGFSGIIFSTSANALIQLTVPEELRGRVLSLHVLLFAGTTPIGSMLIGILAESIGVSFGLLICSALCLAGVLIAYIYHHRTAV